MPLLNQPFGAYFRQTCVGLWILVAVSVIRFLLKPLFGIPYAQGTWYTSVSILVLILLVYYSAKAARSQQTYRDVLGIAAAIFLSSAALIIVAIAIDEFGGIDTYFTDPAHGGELNPWVHMGGHLVAGLLGTLVGWLVGSIVFAITRAVTGSGGAAASR